jgi:PadR family transcriptional regulator PadR
MVWLFVCCFWVQLGVFWYALVMCEVLYGGVYVLLSHAICVRKRTYRIPVEQTYKSVKKMINNYQKEIQTKLTKGLLDMIIMQFLESHPMHGYQVITTIRKSFGIYFGPSTVYPLLGSLEKKGYLKSAWNMESEKPRKVYALTSAGQTMLKFTENSLGMICKTLTCNNAVQVEVQIKPLGNKMVAQAAQ